MPFCRKCGRYLPEYSESCPDCGQSTTSPIINVKKRSGSKIISKANKMSKISKVVISKKTIITVEKIASSPKPTNVTPQIVSVKISKPKTAINLPPTTKEATPIAQEKVAITKKQPLTPKPSFSTKHLVKPKKIRLSKPIVPTPIVQDTPVSLFVLNEPKPVASTNHIDQPIPVVSTNPIGQSEPVTISTKPEQQTRPTIPTPTYQSHEIIKSTLSLKEDFAAHPQDYEKQSFGFNLKCSNDHFWPAGKSLPLSKGKAFCPQCGDRLRKPKRRQRYRKSLF